MLFERATDEMAEGLYDAACPHLEEARKLLPQHVNTRIQLALCYEETRRFASAYSQLEEARNIAETLATEPGPELADKQEAERELMPFPVLDACLHLYAGEKMCPAEIVTALGSLFPALPLEQREAWVARFAKLFSQSIYKWVQSPLSLHVGSLDLERERALQMPVVQKTEWQQ